MNLAPICVYTIIHPARLRAGVSLSEKTKWTRIEAALKKARHEGDEIVVLFTDARDCDLLFAWAPLADVQVGDETSFSLKEVYAVPERRLKTDLTTFVGKKAISAKHIRPYVPCETPSFLIEGTSHPSKWTYTLEDFKEGRQVLKTHLARERSRELRAAKLREAGDVLRCEVCDFDFAAQYPGVGEGFIEVHHRTSLGDRAPAGRTTTLEELALVCANCHRMLHRRDSTTIESLRNSVRNPGEGGPAGP